MRDPHIELDKGPAFEVGGLGCIGNVNQIEIALRDKAK